MHKAFCFELTITTSSVDFGYVCFILYSPLFLSRLSSEPEEYINIFFIYIHSLHTGMRNEYENEEHEKCAKIEACNKK